jgi:hypothetical protein
MSRSQPFEPGDICLQSRLLHQALVARGDSLCHGELVGSALTDILQSPDRRVTRQSGSDEPGLALIILPHGGVE